eukprot:gi/632956977/ref/XP_007894230.1/ PREDICTED: spore wall protein 2-like [Callorhinchus milii]
MAVARQTWTLGLLLVTSRFAVVELISVLTSRPEITVNVGTDALLDCKYTTAIGTSFTLDWRFVPGSAPNAQAMKILYYTNGETYKLGPKSKRLKLVNEPPTRGIASIRLEKTESSDSGKYICDINNPPDFAGTSEIFVNLIVQVPPSTPQCTVSGKPHVGNNITLSCRSTEGRPSPVYVWSEVNPSPGTSAATNVKKDPKSFSVISPISLPVTPPFQEGPEKEEAKEITEMAKEDTTHQTENQAAVRIQAVYRGYMTRKKLVKGNATEADGDLLPQEYADGGASEYSSEEELTFADEDNFGVTGTFGVEGEEEPSGRMEDEQRGEVVADRASVGICASQLMNPLEKSYTIEGRASFEDVNADICGTELRPDTRENSMFEEEIKSRTDNRDICAAELGFEGLTEVTFGDTANVDGCGTELGGPLAGEEIDLGMPENADVLGQGDHFDQAPSEGGDLSEIGHQASDDGDESQEGDIEYERGEELEPSELAETKEESISFVDETQAVEKAESVAEKGEACEKVVEEDVLDIPLDDEEANAAAAKIQASFRGHMTRKKLKGGEKEESERKVGGALEEGEEPDAGGAGPGESADATGGAEGQSEAGEEAKEGAAVNGDQSETAADDGGKDAGDLAGETEAAAPEQ